MLDAFLDYGYPMITQKYVLEQIVKPAGVIEKIEQVIVGRNNT
jgi:AP-3 complex subunit mu